jgi:hypothetical protein
MKNIANRLIVFAASALAFGTVAFGQTRMVAQVPFAFQTVTGTMPAGTYAFITPRNSAGNLVSVENTSTLHSQNAGFPLFDYYEKAGKRGPSIDFVCAAGRCSLKAIRTYNGSMVYPTPHRSRDEEKASPLAVVSIPVKVSNAD